MAQDTLYRMDGETFQHMGEWALRYGPFAREDAEEGCNAMVAWLEAMPTEEAAHWIAQGWPRVYDLCDRAL